MSKTTPNEKEIEAFIKGTMTALTVAASLSTRDSLPIAIGLTRAFVKAYESSPEMPSDVREFINELVADTRIN